MSILLTDTSLGVMLAPDEGAPLTAVPCGAESPCLPCGGFGRLFVCCRKTRDCLCLCGRTHRQLMRAPCPPAPAAIRPSPCGRYLYILSTEADCVHALYLGTGELCYAAPAGVFPRCMRLHPSGRMLLVAGGAAHEAYLLRAPELQREATFGTRDACFAADFWRGGLVLVCAADQEDIQTVVYTLAPGKLRPREVIRLPGQPGGLCVCPDGASALLSTPDGLMKLDLAAGRLLWNLPEWPLCMGLSCKGGLALVSDTLTGQVCLLRHEQPWLSRTLCAGTDAQACFCP